MRIFAIAVLMVTFSFSAKAAEVIPDEICGMWQTAFKKKLRWDHSYESASVLIRSDGRCPLVLSPPAYGALLVIRMTEKPDEYFYQIEDQGNVVEEGILRYFRTPDMLGFQIFGNDARFVRTEKLLDRKQ